MPASLVDATGPFARWIVATGVQGVQCDDDRQPTPERDCAGYPRQAFHAPYESVTGQHGFVGSFALLLERLRFQAAAVALLRNPTTPTTDRRA